MSLVEPFQVLLIDSSDRQLPLAAALTRRLKIVPVAANDWRAALSSDQAQSLAAVVVGCEQFSDLKLLTEVIASYQGPIIAVGPDDTALATAASTAGATEYLTKCDDGWQSLYLAIKCALLKREVEQVHFFKDQFISVASHELKNPLAALRGYSELLLRRLQRGTVDERVERGLQTILQQAFRMQHILDDLHDLARLQRSGIELQMGFYELEPLIQRTISHSERNNCAYQIDLQVATPAPSVYCDSERLQRILSLLISLAGSHSPPEVPVEVLVSSIEHNSTTQAQIIVQSYSGLQSVDVEQAFASFYPTNNSTAINATERLGLYISSAIARLHQGMLRFRRGAEGDGIFELALPQMTELLND